MTEDLEELKIGVITISKSAYSKSKKDLFLLINELPDNEIYSVKNYIEFLIAKNKKNKTESFLDYLKSVPEEDEELTEEAIEEKKIVEKLEKSLKKVNLFL